MTAQEAADAVRAGQTVIVTIGDGPDDPVLRNYESGGMVYQESIAGWSAGVIEPVCATNSDFLLEHFTDVHDLKEAEE